MYSAEQIEFVRFPQIANALFSNKTVRMLLDFVNHVLVRNKGSKGPFVGQHFESFKITEQILEHVPEP